MQKADLAEELTRSGKSTTVKSCLCRKNTKLKILLNLMVGMHSSITQKCLKSPMKATVYKFNYHGDIE